MKGNNFKALWIGLLAFVILLSFKTASFTDDKEADFQLFSTSNVYGYLKPCGWKLNPIGGLARRASYIKQVKQDDRFQLLVDCGDFGSTKVKSQIFKVTYLLTGMALLNYDAINLGEKDLQYGVEFLSEISKMHKLPFISANVYKYGTEELFAKPYLVTEKTILKSAFSEWPPKLVPVIWSNHRLVLR